MINSKPRGRVDIGFMPAFLLGLFIKDCETANDLSNYTHFYQIEVIVAIGFIYLQFGVGYECKGLKNE